MPGGVTIRKRFRGDAPIGMAWMVLASGEFKLAELRRESLARELDRLRPAELVLADGKATQPELLLLIGAAPIARAPDWHFDPERAARHLAEAALQVNVEASGGLRNLLQSLLVEPRRHVLARIVTDRPKSTAPPTAATAIVEIRPNVTATWPPSSRSSAITPRLFPDIVALRARKCMMTRHCVPPIRNW